MSQEDKRRLHKLIVNSKNYNERYRSELKAFGLVLVKTTRHYQIMRADGVGNIVTLACTGSDYRGNMNAFARILRLLESGN